MLNKPCFLFEIQTYLKISIINYFRGPRIGIVIRKLYSKLTILRTIRKDFKEKKSQELDDIIRKGFAVMSNTTIGLALFSPIRPQFLANIEIPYSNFSYFEDTERRF